MKKLALLLLALLAPLAFAQATTQVPVIPYVTLFDGSGAACAGCSLYTYTAGTTTPQATYTDASGVSQNTNPVVLGVDGGAKIWLGLTAYKFVLKDTGGNTLWTVDNVVSLASLSCRYSNSIAYGCTGAMTSQGAATNIVDGNTIKPAVILNANVNGICTVTKYGAVGDCAGSGSTAACKDNHTEIQAAIDACYVTRGSVEFPTNPSQTGQTVYYTSLPINPKGVSMSGPPGGSGPNLSYQSEAAVGIRGAPGQDVFNVPDPTSGGYVTPRNSFTVQDLAIFVDRTVDASASFPNRKPGRTCMDVVTNGTAIITSAVQCEFQPGDVGQAVTVKGTNTTVSSWQSATQVTLATTITAGTGVTAYISAMGLPVSTTIGNCGFAYDDSTGIDAVTTAKSVFRNVVIRGTGGAEYSNNSCGFFFQANTGPTWTRWEDVSVGGTTFGFNFVPVSAAAPSTAIYAGLKDYNVFDHVYIAAAYPFTVYGAELQQIREMQIFTPNGTGPQFIDAYGTTAHTSSWKIDIPEMEASGACLATPVGFRIAGTAHQIKSLSIGTCANGVIQWDARDSTVDNALFGTASGIVFNLTGGMNTFYQPDGADNFSRMTRNITGTGNTFKTGRLWNPFGPQPAREQFAQPGLTGLSSAPFGDPTLSRGAVALNRTHDFIDKGAAGYYFNSEDLWFWPQELMDAVNGHTPVLVADTSSPTGSTFTVAASGSQTLSMSDMAYWYIGSQFPAGKMRVYFQAKSASGTPTITPVVQAYYSASWHTIGCNSATSALSTTFAVFSCDANASGLSGDKLLISFTGGTQDVYIAWIGVRPYDSDPYGNYAAALGHSIVALWTGASGTLVDDNEGGSGYESGAVSWGTTITGTYYVDCFTTGWTMGSTLGRKIVATTVGIPIDGTTFTYGVDIPTISAGRGNTIPSVTCMAIQ